MIFRMLFLIALVAVFYGMVRHKKFSVGMVKTLSIIGKLVFGFMMGVFAVTSCVLFFSMIYIFLTWGPIPDLHLPYVICTVFLWIISGLFTLIKVSDFG